MSAEVCTIKLWAGHGRSEPCGRPLTNPCGLCREFDKHQTDWAALFNEYRDTPRVAVEGDI